MLLEVCVDDEIGLRAALAHGAGRLEVCSRLDLGGLTPTDAFLERCRAATRAPLMAMIRPRGGDFAYTPGELATMAADIDRLRALGADGFVFGALTPKREVDTRATAELIAAARPNDVTFHRAFDDVPDPAAALEALVELGVGRVLTSGGAADAFQGRAALARLVELARGRIVVLAGGGVRAHNAQAIVDASGVVELHSSTPFDSRGLG